MIDICPTTFDLSQSWRPLDIFCVLRDFSFTNIAVGVEVERIFLLVRPCQFIMLVPSSGYKLKLSALHCIHQCMHPVIKIDAAFEDEIKVNTGSFN